ncbi:MAG: BtpA/SgcQ family protein [Phycisphaerae bacterium]
MAFHLFSQPAGRTVIGMLHVPALPGSPNYRGDWRNVQETVFEDADVLASEGVDALMLENFGDQPFFKGRVPHSTSAYMAVLAAEVNRRLRLPLGLNVLRNDGQTALAVAAATGASFVRVNVLTGARLTDQCVIEGIAAELQRTRALLQARHVKVLADVDVKHSAPLAPLPLEVEVDDTLKRGQADGLIVSGTGTGKPTDLEKLKRVKAVARAAGGTVPVLVGSGVTTANVQAMLAVADGVIVGTSLKKDGDVFAPVDPLRVRELLKAARG